MLVNKLCLGSVQWGSKYGISNTNGQTSVDEVSKILKEARLNGIELIDTASSYGNAENILGNSDLSFFSVITKTPKFEKDIIKKIDADKLVIEFKQSLEKLNISSCYGLLLHHKEDVFKSGYENIISALNNLKSSGLVKKIGVSIYDSNRINEVIEKLKPDIIQLPLNILDQRVIQNGTLKYLKSMNIEIHVRSIFLQGLLIMPYENIPPYFDTWSDKLNEWKKICLEKKMSCVEAALNFVINQPDVDYCIIGTENLKQLKQCILAAKNDQKLNVSQLATEDTKLINPVNWKI